MKDGLQTAIEDAPAAARAAGLRYVNDAMPGILRQRDGDSVRYVDADGAEVRDEATLARIKSLAIPPAWTGVWICARDNGHLQATGRDARGRKQYRYHPKWRAVRDEVKYERMISFGKALPSIRKAVDEALRLPGLPREKVLATVVYLLQVTMMRIGNEEYARTNKSFGLTTLRNRHVRVDGSEVEFKFRGKSGVYHALRLADRRLARIIQRARTAWPGTVPVRGRRRQAACGRLGGRQRLPAQHYRRRLYRQGFPHLVRHGTGRPGAARI